MFEKLNATVEKYEQLMAELGDPAVQADTAKFRENSKAIAEMQPLVDAYREYQQVVGQIAATQEMLKDPDMRELAEEELQALETRRDVLFGEIKVLMIPKDPNDAKNVMIEIRAGTGGDEAALFASDLFRMYSRYAERQGWKLEVLSMSDSGAGGIKEVIAMIEGRNAYSRLKYESGVHRVQRVPATEASGRIHTSTATVAVLPEAEDVDIEIKPEEIRIDTTRASSAGGQHANTTDSGIRILHIPTGTIVIAVSRSQHQNRVQAMQMLRTRLYDLERQKADQERAAARKGQVGSGDRSERIRTYNFPQGRVSDHRINLTLYKIDRIMDGELDEIIDALIASDQAERLAELE
jgi:peptide chain release factor 1